MCIHNYLPSKIWFPWVVYLEFDFVHFDLKGLAQCTELCLQLRGEAEKRQVPNAKLALQHNLGLGGAAVVALYKMGYGGNAAASR